jgi:hypothetical protein
LLDFKKYLGGFTMTNSAIRISVGTRKLEVQEHKLTGEGIKQAAGISVTDYDLFLEVSDPDNTTHIADDAFIDLVDDMKFLVKHKTSQTVPIMINGAPATAPSHVMTGAAIKQVGNIPAEYALFLVQTSIDDEQIADQQVVYLIQNEQFFAFPANVNNGGK